MANSAECPSCGVLVDVGKDAKLGQVIICGSCKTELEVVWLTPIELDILIDVDEQVNDFDYDPDADPYEDYEYTDDDYN